MIVYVGLLVLHGTDGLVGRVGSWDGTGRFQLGRRTCSTYTGTWR